MNQYESFFKNYFDQLITREFSKLNGEKESLYNLVDQHNLANLKFNDLLGKLQSKNTNLFIENKLIDNEFENNNNINNKGGLESFLKKADLERIVLTKQITDLLSKNELNNIAFKSRTKTAESVHRKMQERSSEVVHDIIGFQIIVLDNRNFVDVFFKIFNLFESEITKISNWLTAQHKFIKKTKGINSIHHKGYHLLISHAEEKFPVELQVLPRYSYFWHQINHDTLYKETIDISYEEELAIRFFGYICNVADIFEIINSLK